MTTKRDIIERMYSHVRMYKTVSDMLNLRAEQLEAEHNTLPAKGFRQDAIESLIKRDAIVGLIEDLGMEWLID